MNLIYTNYKFYTTCYQTKFGGWCKLINLQKFIILISITAKVEEYKWIIFLLFNYRKFKWLVKSYRSMKVQQCGTKVRVVSLWNRCICLKKSIFFRVNKVSYFMSTDWIMFKLTAVGLSLYFWNNFVLSTSETVIRQKFKCDWTFLYAGRLVLTIF